MVYLWLSLLLVEEIGFFVWSLVSKRTHKYKKAICSISLGLLFLLSVVTNLTPWSFRFFLLGLFLIVKVLLSTITLIKKKEENYRISKAIAQLVRNSMTSFLVVALALVFPPYSSVENLGDYEVNTTSYTWVDESRQETYLNDGSNRALTTEFFYPTDVTNTYPLVVFSHGAFGYSGSNYSTFMTLASHGYVVASVGHTYQAFFSKDAGGNMAIVDQGFLNQAIEINAMVNTENDQEVYETTSSWMNLRTSDLNFVIDTIINFVSQDNVDPVFQVTDVNHIGLFGHSLGGAASAQMGRLRNDVSAAIVLDGTMLGEEIGFEDGSVILNPTAYPVPLLNVYAQDHYDNAKAFVGDGYNNFLATANAVEAYETVFLNAGHLNFTDLPLFSPLLSNALGVGLIEPRYCIEQMNDVVLDFFNHFLKNNETLNLKTEY